MGYLRADISPIEELPVVICWDIPYGGLPDVFQREVCRQGKPPGLPLRLYLRHRYIDVYRVAALPIDPYRRLCKHRCAIGRAFGEEPIGEPSRGRCAPTGRGRSDAGSLGNEGRIFKPFRGASRCAHMEKVRRRIDIEACHRALFRVSHPPTPNLSLIHI